MKQNIDRLSDWIRVQEEISSPLTEEVNKVALETDFFLRSCDRLHSAYSALLGKLDAPF